MPTYYELEVSLYDLQPRIWRRFLIRDTATFAALHEAIQLAFGWESCHLWEFRRPTRGGGPIAGPPNPGFGEETPDAARVKLSAFFGEAERCDYIYDFGDDWRHDVKRVAVHTESKAFRRRLLAGERAAPPEDCGGWPGYERVVEFVETGEDPFGDGGLESWLGDWRPDAFDLAAVKAAFDR